MWQQSRGGAAPPNRDKRSLRNAAQNSLGKQQLEDRGNSANNVSVNEKQPKRKPGRVDVSQARAAVEFYEVEVAAIIPYEVLKDRKLMRDHTELVDLREYCARLQRNLEKEQDERKIFELQCQKYKTQIEELAESKLELTELHQEGLARVDRLRTDKIELHNKVKKLQHDLKKERARFEIMRDENYELRKDIRFREQHAAIARKRLEEIHALRSSGGRKRALKAMKSKVAHTLRWVTGNEETDEYKEYDVDGYCSKCNGNGECEDGFREDLNRCPPDVCGVCEHPKADHAFMDDDSVGGFEDEDSSDEEDDDDDEEEDEGAEENG